MPAKKRNGNGSQSGIGSMSNKQLKRKKPVNSDVMVDIKPLTKSQEKVFEEYKNGKNIFAYGAAGTGKTFIALYLALREVLDQMSPYENVYIVRSLVSTREIGFLPGDHEDKSFLYQIPYKHMVKYMFEMADDNEFEMLYGALKGQETIKFWSTSFIRGTTLDNSIILVDEMQNLNFHELDSIITRVGENSKILFCGDASQSDLTKTNERNGILDFMKIYNEAWAKYPGVSALKLAQAKSIFNQLKPILDEKILWFAYEKDEPIGFFICIPEMNQIFKYVNGKLDLIGKIKTYYHLKIKKSCKKIIGLVFGIVPRHQGKGVDGALIMASSNTIQKELAYTDMELNWIPDFNKAMIKVATQVQATDEVKPAKVHHTYRYNFDRSIPVERIIKK